jgi:hypothetical protein
MDSYEPHAHSFIVKVWLEELSTDALPARWRGRVTHVPDNTQRYFEDWETLTRFIQQFLAQSNNEHRQ